MLENTNNYIPIYTLFLMTDNKGYKRNVMVSIDQETLRLAKEKNINVSAAAEDGVLKKIYNNALIDKSIYPEELASEDPEHYWISPKDGLCHKRGQEQFFINENGSVFAVTKKEFMKRLNTIGRHRTNVKTRKIRKGQSIMNYENSDFANTTL